VEGSGETNGTCRLDEVVSMVQSIASNQQEKAMEIKERITDVKTWCASGCQGTNGTGKGNVSTKVDDAKLDEVANEIKAEIRDKYEDLRGLLASNPTDCRPVAVDPSKQALISALECKYLHFVSYSIPFHC